MSDWHLRLLSARPSPAPVLRRACACGGTPGPTGECEACRRRRVQRAARSAGPAVAPPVVHEVLRSPGRALDPAVRAEMEPRFGHSFADVRVHADGQAAESARAVGAHAYAVGRDVVFGAGRYAPGSAEGRRLIAHELAHVVQQRGAAATLQPRLEIGAADDPAEREAERAAEGAAAVTEGGPAVVRRQRTQPTRAEIRRDDRLRRLARWPGEALAAWRRLSEGERTVLVMYMAGTYDSEFARQFLAVASDPRQRQRAPTYHATNLPVGTPAQLRARGWRMAAAGPGQEHWVRPNGDVLHRIISAGSTSAPAPAAEQATPAPAPAEAPPAPQPQAPEPEEAPPRVPPRSTFGREVQRRDGASVAGVTGRATRYEDGTITLESPGGGTTTYRPRPRSSGGVYDIYDQAGDLIPDVVWQIDTDEVFGASPPP
ncbi:MAG TPA: DUF4157 domain-containing protein [Longimicrobium sp.]|nr:DUF4157 domain-containing protein [Longimicrobium sp.]